MNKYKIITSALDIIVNMYTGPFIPNIETTTIVKNICKSLGFNPSNKQLSKDREDITIVVIPATMSEFNEDQCMQCQRIQIGNDNKNTYIFIMPSYEYISDSDIIKTFLWSADLMFNAFFELDFYANLDSMDFYIRLFAKCFFLYLLYHAIYENPDEEKFKEILEGDPQYKNAVNAIIKTVKDLCTGYTIDWKGIEIAVEDYFINCKAINWLQA